ncbi:MAG: hypothetical protein ACRERC_11230 [Candidatus Binatia bacterium]
MRVWRLIGGAPQGLFTFAGAIDAAVLRAVMQHVRRLTTAVPGEWRVEVYGSGLDGGLLQAVKDDLGDLRRSGLRPRLALAPRLRPPLGILLTRPVLATAAAKPGVLLH